MKPLRVLLTADSSGGVWTFTTDLVEGLDAAGCEILLLVTGGGLDEETRSNMKGCSGVTLVEDDTPLEWMHKPWDAIDASEERLLRIERDFRPDVVHLGSYSHAAFGWRAPVLVTAHSCVFSWWAAVNGGFPSSEWCEYHGRVSRGLASARLVAVPTHAMARMLENHYDFSTPTIVVSNGRALSGFRPSPVKQNIILSAGRVWDAGKNMQLLAGIAPTLRLPVRIVGDCTDPVTGSRTAWPSVDLPGKLNASEMRLEFCSASIYAAPALYEPFGLAVLEAAASGCALVLSDIPSFRELWDGCAVFCDPRNLAHWRAVLEEVGGDAEWRQAMSRAAIERSRRFSAVQMVAAYLHCYRKLIAGEQHQLGMAA